MVGWVSSVVVWVVCWWAGCGVVCGWCGVWCVVCGGLGVDGVVRGCGVAEAHDIRVEQHRPFKPVRLAIPDDCRDLFLDTVSQ